MPTIYSTAADRATRVKRKDQGPATSWSVSWRQPSPSGSASSLLYRAQAPALAAAEQALAAKSLVNLNEAVVERGADGGPAAGFPTSAERRFAAERIEAFLLGADTPLGARRRVDSVGALARLTVPVPPRPGEPAPHDVRGHGSPRRAVRRPSPSTPGRFRP